MTRPRRALVLSSLLVAAACGSPSGPRPDPVSAPPETLRFRGLSTRVEAGACEPAPAFEVASTEDAWIDLFDRATGCRDDAGEIDLPAVRFDQGEVGTFAWWALDMCAGTTIEVESVVRRDRVITVAARSVPGDSCDSRGTLESVLAITRSGLVAGNETFEFRLDGAVRGEATAE